MNLNLSLPSLSETTRYLTGGLVIAAGYLYVCRQREKARVRKKWDTVGTDVVVLHRFRRNKKCSTTRAPAPHEVKLETYLRMTNIDYVSDLEQPLGPKNKSPWITINGRDLAESQPILDQLADKFRLDLSKHLSKEDKAVARALRVMVEEQFDRAFQMERRFADEKRPTTSNKRPVNPELAAVRSICLDTLKALSDYLGQDKPYLMGAMPCEVDCAMFGFLSTICNVNGNLVYNWDVEKDYPNLAHYKNRMRDKYWPDWDKLHEADDRSTGSK